MFFNFLACLLLYTCKRLYYRVKQFLSNSFPGLHSSCSQHQPLRGLIKRNSYLLESKSFSYKTKIVFLPIDVEVKLFNGVASEMWISTPRCRYNSSEKHLTVKTAFPVEELNIFYEGFLKFMNSEFYFCSRVKLEKVAILTQLSINPHASKSVVENVFIDGVDFQLQVGSLMLNNKTSYFVLSRILKIISSFILCLLEYIIRFNLNLEFSSTDSYRAVPHQTLKYALRDYIERTNDESPTSSESDDLTISSGSSAIIEKSFISGLNFTLVEENGKTLIPIIRNVLNSGVGNCAIEPIEDVSQLSEHDTDDEFLSGSEGSSEQSTNEDESADAELVSTTSGEVENVLHLENGFVSENASDILLPLDEDDSQDESSSEDDDDEDDSQEHDSSESDEDGQSEQSSEFLETEDDYLENGIMPSFSDDVVSDSDED